MKHADPGRCEGWPYTDQQPKLPNGPCSSSRLMVVVSRGIPIPLPRRWKTDSASSFQQTMRTGQPSPRSAEPQPIRAHPGLTPGRPLVLEIGPRRPVWAALQEDHPIGRDPAAPAEMLPRTPAGGRRKPDGQEVADAGHICAGIAAAKAQVDVAVPATPEHKAGGTRRQ